MLNLRAVFGYEVEPIKTPVAVTAETAPVAEPGGPDDIHPLDAWLAAEDFSRWRYVPGRGYLGPDSDEADDFDGPPEPCPCSACGSLDWWEDLAGGRHCTQCEADKLARSLKLADRAERLRKRAPARRPASTGAQGGEETGAGDTQHVGSPKPSAAALGRLRGREDG